MNREADQLIQPQAHPFFAGIQWDSLYMQPAPHRPRVDHELDTQNFEHFDEDMAPGAAGVGALKFKVCSDFLWLGGLV